MQNNPDQPAPPGEATDSRTANEEAVVCKELLGDWRGMFDESERKTFERINREVMSEIGELKKALAEFDAYRHVWAEISANNVAPGRSSGYAKRLEVLQGRALCNLDSAAWRLRTRIRGEVKSPND